MSASRMMWGQCSRALAKKGFVTPKITWGLWEKSIIFFPWYTYFVLHVTLMILHTQITMGWQLFGRVNMIFILIGIRAILIGAFVYAFHTLAWQNYMKPHAALTELVFLLCKVWTLSHGWWRRVCNQRRTWGGGWGRPATGLHSHTPSATYPSLPGATNIIIEEEHLR